MKSNLTEITKTPLLINLFSLNPTIKIIKKTTKKNLILQSLPRFLPNNHKINLAITISQSLNPWCLPKSFKTMMIIQVIFQRIILITIYRSIMSILNIKRNQNSSINSITSIIKDSKCFKRINFNRVRKRSKSKMILWNWTCQIWNRLLGKIP